MTLNLSTNVRIECAADVDKLKRGESGIVNVRRSEASSSNKKKEGPRGIYYK